LGAADDIGDFNACFAVEPARLFDEGGGGIESGDNATASGEAARDGTRAGAEVEHVLAQPPNAESAEPVEKSLGKSGTVTAVILGRAPKIDVHVGKPRKPGAARQGHRPATGLPQPNRALSYGRKLWPIGAEASWREVEAFAWKKTAASPVC